ncbi:MAG: NB-ARC domain-containing protein [Nitrososphaerales archaeon]
MESDALNSFQLTGGTEFLARYRHSNGNHIHIALNSVNFGTGSTAHPILHAVFGAVLVSVVRSFEESQKEPIRFLSAADSERIIGVYVNKFGDIEYDVEMFGIHFLPFHFVGRTRELAQLREFLHRDTIGVISNPTPRSSSANQSITGLGGTGKSTLAIKYALDAKGRRDYDLIIRLDATNETALYQEFLHLANHLRILDPEKLGPKDLVRMIYKWLSYYRRLLIIFDNPASYNDLQAARVGKESESVNFMPPPVEGQQVHCIITTRNENFKTGDKVILNVFSPEEARDYIQHYLKVPAVDADTLAKLLGYFPLALSQAVAYLLVHSDESINSYYERYRTEKNAQREFLDGQRLPEDPYQDSVYTTWNISFEAVKKRNTLASDLMNVLPYFAKLPIPVAAAKPKAASQQAFDDAIACLEKYSLIHRDKSTLRMHDLVQTVSRLQQKTVLKKSSLIQALSQAYDYVNPEGTSNRHTAEFIPHALNIIHSHDDFIPAEGVKHKIGLLIEIGTTQHFDLFFSEQGRDALAFAERIFDRDSSAPFRTEVGELMLRMYVHLANSRAGSGDPEGYRKTLDKLINSPHLSVKHIQEIAKDYGVNLDLEDVKQSLLNDPTVARIPLLPRLLRWSTPETFFNIVLSRIVKPLWIHRAPEALESFGASDLAIAYLLFSGRLPEAKRMAERYFIKAHESNDVDAKIGSYCLLVEARVFNDDFTINTAIGRLVIARTLLKKNPDANPYWYDQIHFLLAVLYAAQGNYVRSYQIVTEVWNKIIEIIEKGFSIAPSNIGDEGIKNRLHLILKLLRIFERPGMSTQLTKLFVEGYRLIGRMFNASQKKDDMSHFDRETIKNCFEKSLKYDPNCSLSHYDYGRFLYQHAGTRAEATVHFETVRTIEDQKNAESKLRYQHFGREGRNLPKYMRHSSLVTSPSSLYYLACVYQVLINCKKDDKTLCLPFLDLLEKQQQEQPELLSREFFTYFRTKPKI